MSCDICKTARCQNCKKDFIKKHSKLNKFCSSFCYFKGRVFSDETRKKMSDAMNKLVLDGRVAWNKGMKGVMVGEKASAWKGGKRSCIDCGVKKTHHSKNYLRCNPCSKITFRGAGNPSWRGGITPENLRVRGSDEYKKWRQSVFNRDNFTCQRCCKEGHIQADHVLPFALFPDLRFEVLNGQTLCVSCHKLKTSADRQLYKYAT